MADKIAVIQTAFPGDVILSTAMFEAIADLYPGCQTAVVVRPESAELLENNPHIYDIIKYDKYAADKGIKGIFRLSARLRGFDRAFIVQRFLRSAIIAYLAGIPERIGFDNATGKMLYTRKIAYKNDMHEVERCLSLLGDIQREYRPKIYIDDDQMGKAEELLKSSDIDSDFAVVAPGSTWATKRYPYYPGLTHLIMQKFGLRSVLLGGNSDLATASSIAGSSLDKPVNLAGKTSLMESAAIISKAKIVFSNDSAPAHIAAALGVPVIAIFGPTIPEFGFAPYSDNSAVVDIGELYCRPCGIHGAKSCPQKHFRCMVELQPAKIIKAAESLLG